jgi:beta,beta-carotene 9',10'-dioxygenase
MPGKFELLRSLIKDNPEPVETKVTGEIPEWLSGTLFRNGPGRFEYGDKKFNHLL